MKINIYTAGLFDGEGCFSIAKSKLQYSKKHSSRPYRFQAYARLNITNKKVANFLLKNFGGSLQVITPKNENHAIIYAWQINGKNLDNFLNKISPYLIVKESQSKVLLKFQKLKRQVGNSRISDSLYSKSENLYNSIRDLNKRGRK